MPAPSITLTHLKTSTQYKGADLVNRMWFQWSDRKVLGNLVVRIEFLDESGTVLTESSVKLPKVTQTGLLDGKPTYDSSVWIQLDDAVRDTQTTQFRYYTLSGLFKKSDAVTEPMSGKVDDLSSFG